MYVNPVLQNKTNQFDKTIFRSFFHFLIFNKEQYIKKLHEYRFIWFRTKKKPRFSDEEYKNLHLLARCNDKTNDRVHGRKRITNLPRPGARETRASSPCMIEGPFHIPFSRGKLGLYGPRLNDAERSATCASSYSFTFIISARRCAECVEKKNSGQWTEDKQFSTARTVRQALCSCLVQRKNNREIYAAIVTRREALLKFYRDPPACEFFIANRDPRSDF